MHNRLLRTVDIAGEQFDVGSDFHWGTEGQYGVEPTLAATHLFHLIKQQQRSAYLLLPGDIFHGESKDNWRIPVDVTDATNEFLTLISRLYDRAIFVPGNHCLRRHVRTDDPWNSIDPPRGVIMPRRDPIVTLVGNARILAGNIFYDGHFLNGASPHQEQFEHLLNSTTDGTSLLHGSASIPDFRDMTKTLASALAPEVDALVTHVPPTPAVATWRIPEPHARGPEGFPGRLLYDPEGDAIGARHMGNTSIERFRSRLNAKSAMLGSNVFDPALGANPKHGITAVFGHHHRNENETVPVDGQNIRLVSHQVLQRYVVR